MNFKLIGTQYGGWALDTSLVPSNSTIISAGIGEDISFDLFLIKNRNCNIIGVDPTIKSHTFIKNQNGLTNFTLIKKALHSIDDDIITIYKNKIPNHVSESVLQSHMSAHKFDSYYAETINLDSLFNNHNNISVIKMDIEGSEYDVIECLSEIPDSVKQFCVEFHHFCTEKTIDDTNNAISKLNSLGFENFFEKPSDKKLSELTFWR
jgi:FkbM family methyltransferase